MSKLHVAVAIVGLVFLVLLILTVHELGHYLSSLALGATPDQLSFRLCGINPCVGHPPFHGWQESLVRASGGFTAAGLLILVWLFLLPSPVMEIRRWIIGLLLITLGFEQIANGLMEWLANDAYRAHTVPFHFAAFAGSGIHLTISKLRIGSWMPVTIQPSISK